MEKNPFLFLNHASSLYTKKFDKNSSIVKKRKMPPDKISLAIDLLSRLLERNKIDAGHGIDHALIVFHHAQEALKDENFFHTDLSDFPGKSLRIKQARIKQSILLAALLHDADDNKFFPQNKGYENARNILNQIDLPEEQIDLILRMISLVSCSKNRNTLVEPRYLLIPRWADRLEAMGKIGIYRAYVYSQYIKNPLYLPDTPRPKTMEELLFAAHPSRFENYQGVSISMIDHLYDKVFHLANIETDNPYFQEKIKERHQELIDFLLDFGRKGKIDEDLLRGFKNREKK